ncbi:SDR family NAD(P)-dependent oxidoreductase [Pseudovibrio sp. SPO723]|uniref:SDR family NAD(P)-dependent oxidoreductase n=1 Tax=Nesiotobacter zosterae TaxID=392721 RepID=UPI0029C3D4F9|nr:SDR family NAD(P)-dependent oxidoreductase [Pseudovibrio sp. SPO723]MDX5593240.1 SDR family NAD(P)-dependent oxidoreductase [Pseudovibrio sp. SPO723]
MAERVLPWQSAWVLGASSGIGAAVAQQLGRAGVKVAVSARSVAALDQLAEEVQGLVSVPVDVTDEDSVRASFDKVCREVGVPELIIYCAAVYTPGGLSVLTAGEAMRHMDVNYGGAVRTLQAVLPAMTERGSGAIGIVSSLTGYAGLPNASVYGPTKAALISLCETLKPELDAVGIQLSVINPGFVRTPLTDKNEFEMPFIIEPDEAGSYIIKGMRKGTFDVAFPWQMALILRVLRHLPYSLYFRMMRRLLR